MMVLGLIQTESAFIGDAVSVAGARGLMQLMPVTLEYVIALESVA
jgi:soluble lytic murein transglycosylase-like protein